MASIDNTMIRLCRPDDVNKLCALDLKTYTYPENMNFWREASKDMDTQILLVDVLYKTVGFIVWTVNDKESLVTKLGVLPKFRLRGLGRLLMEACYRHSKNKGCNSIKIVVPEIHCFPGDPEDVAVFLSRVGFAATKILPNWKRMYGQLVDGFIFERKINAKS